jgi:hypothetical protein
MDRIFAQQGETTPSEHGVELRPKKAGEKPVNDKEGARQKKLAAAKPQPGEAGRPNGAKDMNGRRPKRVVPKQAVGETVVWAIGAREELAAALRPGFLEMRGKASVRSLSDADAKVLDRLVFAALCQVPPHTAPDPDAALAAAAVPPAVDALYRQAVANHTGVLTADADRRYQALAVALAALGAVLWFAMGSEAEWLAMGGAARVVKLSWVVAAGILAYFATLALLGFRLRDFRRRAAA